MSVVVAVYNEEKYIRRCLETLLSQQVKGLYEVIVVDDGSVDKTISKIKDQISKIKGKDEGKLLSGDSSPRRGGALNDEGVGSGRTPMIFKVSVNGVGLRVFGLPHSGKGPAKARNFGAERARGKILVFVDGDMEFGDKNFINELVEPIAEGKTKGTFSKEEYVANWDNGVARCWNYNEGLGTARRIPEDYPDEGKDFRAILKSEFVRVGGFSDIGYTDTWSLAEKLGYRPVAIAGAKYWHYNPGSLREAFGQARWIGGRRYKLGWVGELTALLRVSLPVAKAVGIYKSLKYREWRFFFFKLVYNTGMTCGILGI
jgi:glycosyltransferase involved in cell wall biosynthesis